MSTIDLSQVPAPAVIEILDYEQILADRKAALIADYPEAEAALERESSPLLELLEENAYRELILRQRINDAAKAVMLPYALGTDLDVLATLFGVTRLTIEPAQPDAEPPVPAVMESDADLRRRVQLSLDGLSVAGPERAYVYHALSADGSVLDAAATSPADGEVLVTVLSRNGDGTADQTLLDAVEAAVNAEDVRPLTDKVTVQSAIIVHYTIEATIYTYAGPDPTVVMAQANDQAAAYVAEQHRLGHDITLSALYGVLQRAGVQRVELTAPAAALVIDREHAAYCDSITLTYGGVDE